MVVTVIINIVLMQLDYQNNE